MFISVRHLGYVENLHRGPQIRSISKNLLNHSKIISDCFIRFIILVDLEIVTTIF